MYRENQGLCSNESGGLNGASLRWKVQSRNEIVENLSVKVGSNKKQISVFPVFTISAKWREKSP